MLFTTQMLITLPAWILLFAGLAILLVRWMRPKFSYTWLIAAGASIGGFALLLFIRLRLPGSFQFPAWKPVDIFNTSPMVRIDYVAWPFALAVMALVAADILTGVARERTSSTPYTWVVALVLGGFGLLSVMAGNPLTLLLAWGALDLGELVVLLVSVDGRDMGIRSVIAFAAQTAGIFFALWAILTSQTKGTPLGWDTIPDSAGIFLLLAAALRLGVLPLHLPYDSEPNLRRGLGTLLRLIPAASSLMLLARLPASVAALPGVSWLVGLAALGGFYAGGMWILSPDEIAGRPYWMIGAAALAVISALHGQPTASLAWGLILLLAGGFIFLFSAHGRGVMILWALCAVGIAGLPFTLAANGWPGLVGSGISIWSAAVSVVIVELLIFGFLRHGNRTADDLTTMERWVQSIYPMGLFALIAALFFLGFKGWPGSFTPGSWWVSVPVAAIVAWFGFWWVYQRRYPAQAASRAFMPGWAIAPARQALDGLTALLRLDWVYRLIWQVLRQVERLLSGLTMIFEGDGGVLWAFVLLTLVITLLQVRIQP
jgi:hypothetical protein